jgi:membrane protein YqaA with SNARE-associated domain
VNEPTIAPTEPEKEPTATQTRSPMDYLRALLPIAFALLFSAIVIVFFSRYESQIETLKGYGYLGAFIIGFVGNATVILPAPSLAVTTALGGVLNPVLVGVAAGAGEALGEMTGYLAGMSGNAVIENSARYEAVHGYMQRYGAWVFFILAAIPNPFFDVAGIAAGAVRFPVWLFLLSAWAGKTVKGIIFAGAGRQLLGSSHGYAPSVWPVFINETS